MDLIQIEIARLHRRLRRADRIELAARNLISHGAPTRPVEWIDTCYYCRVAIRGRNVEHRKDCLFLRLMEALSGR